MKMVYSQYDNGLPLEILSRMHTRHFYFCIRFLVGYGIVGVCTSTLGRMRGIKHDLNTVKKYSYKNWPYQYISDPIKVFNLELITIMQYCSVAGTLEAAPAPDLEMLVASPERFC